MEPSSAGWAAEANRLTIRKALQPAAPLEKIGENVLLSRAHASVRQVRPRSARRWSLATIGQVLAAMLLLLTTVSAFSTPRASAATPQRLDLRVLVLDDGSSWVEALRSQLDVEGVPHFAVQLTDSSRPVIDAAFLSSGDHGYYQAVVAPNYYGANLASGEVAALRAYEAAFAVREIDGFNWANPEIGLNYADFSGDLSGVTATVTAAGAAQGFQYLNGPVPFAQGSYSYVAQPLTSTSSPPMPAGASFVPLVTAPAPNTGAAGSIVGVYSKGGVEQLIITAAFNFVLPQFKILAHGMITWATRGVHLGYNRNRLTFQVDDAFAEVALWDSEHNCTPGEDCPRGPDGESIYPPLAIRMTPDDVQYAVQWEQANDYVLTLAFNGFYAAADDPLTQALVANKSSFRWLNHGYEHIYQGCTQDFTVVPWRCATDANGAVGWRSYDEITNEINANIGVATSYGLPIDPREYLSGEHSGLRQLPQQADDNPNFASALTAAGVTFIGADASRETGSRQVGSALTVPRHPTAVYYNTATTDQAVDEYNWLYTARADGGSGYCEDNPATATCIAPLDASGYLDYIVPTDAAFDLHFMLSNDPRPFYAHTSNLAGKRILYPLLDRILSTYKSAFAPSTPLVNLTLTQVAQELGNQGAWAASGMAVSPEVTGYVEQGQVVITNPTGVPVPITVPEGASVPGMTLESYGGERSAWLAPAPTTTINLQTPPPLSISGTEFTVGQAGAVSFTVAVSPAPTMSMAGALPAGLSFVADASGSGAISGTPAAGTAGSYPITVTATTGSGRYDYAVTLNVRDLPRITSASGVTVRQGSAFTFTVTSTGPPTATVSSSGTLPAGVSFTSLSDGTARLAGTPATGTAGTYPITFTATNTVGSTTQAFTLIVGRPPVFTSATSATAQTGQAFTFTITSVGPPTAAITRSGTLPAGITFTARTDGTAVLSGTPGPNSYGTYPLTFTATNTYGTVRQNFTLTVNKVPLIYSNETTNFTVGTAGSFTVRSEAFPRATVSMTGTLPSGVGFTPNTNGTALLSGTPAAGTGGQYPLVFKATNAVGSSTQNFTLSVREAPKITSPSTATLTRGQSSSFTITATGWPLPTISRSGTLPPGMSFTTGSGTARLSGTPSTLGTWTLTITAKNAVATVTQTLTIRVV